MTPVSEQNKLIARTVADVFGKKPSVSRYWDAKNKSHVDILVCNNTPSENINSYSTVSLSDFQIGLVDDRHFGVELVTACSSSFTEMPNIVATCAFNVINSDYSIEPGITFPNVIDMYDTNLTMKHVLFVPPFLWEKKFETLILEQKTVTWLMLVPISESELKFAEQYGSSSLEKIFETEQINVFDLNRNPVA